ncbi:YihY/virulence factor BrkB family protein [Halobacterium wangiae]|uniref:YihY/virulence factor BrkB family protein n=1 Tax=Halobacterium wangiae TaxID=2902623 RepID=UPI001E5F4D41|nr:YihY/virulence factor BrkB family protein [Halobacterium wangiae]
MTRLRNAIGLLKQMVRTARDEQVTFLSAAVAYYAFVSIVPLLLLGVAVGTAVGGEALVDAVVGNLDQFLTDTGQDVVRDALTSARGQVSATAAGLALLMWSGLKLFRGLDVAFSRIYGVQAIESLPKQVTDATVVLATIAVAVVASVGIGFLVPSLGVVAYVNVATVTTLFVSLSLVFLPAYYVFPNVPMTVRQAVPGATFAALGWTALSQSFRVYTGYVGGMEVYGFLGAALLLVTWLYVGAIIITLGAVLNAVLSGRTDDDDESARPPPEEAPDIAELGAEVEAMRAELDAKTVSKQDLESDLKRYVRARMRRGHARGWGPYLVLLYGTAMTIGAFVYLGGGWAILAMVVVWLSTLGLYTLMVLFGLGANAIGLPGRLADRVRSWRS